MTREPLSQTLSEMSMRQPVWPTPDATDTGTGGHTHPTAPPHVPAPAMAGAAARPPRVVMPPRIKALHDEAKARDRADRALRGQPFECNEYEKHLEKGLDEKKDRVAYLRQLLETKLTHNAPDWMQTWHDLNEAERAAKARTNTLAKAGKGDVQEDRITVTRYTVRSNAAE